MNPKPLICFRFHYRLSGLVAMRYQQQIIELKLCCVSTHVSTVRLNKKHNGKMIFNARGRFQMTDRCASSCITHLRSYLGDVQQNHSEYCAHNFQAMKFC